MRVLLNDGSSLDIREEEILYFSSYKNAIFVHTKEGEFVLPTTLSDLLAAYKDKGFERLDRSNVVNLSQITSFDSERKLALFNDQGQFATVSESNESRLKRYLAVRNHGKPPR
ncbi:LytTR family DNA-binding domain-containing protein [Paenibacillus sp. NFR01]|uniref:LytTR family DNA-binding domain-containing protein n=1 Tax=Paenibacillus sp. NFR01 TaxID=1566279 RepID=UPI0008B5B516|nr:LytTR family DNA-binding domain-containing protein [Paenibacillus sp. NFR01]SET56865.1 LytTr DNA-binding domain-containing protein [Paenibacillus sp. NFR01]